MAKVTLAIGVGFCEHAYLFISFNDYFLVSSMGCTVSALKVYYSLFHPLALLAKSPFIINLVPT